MTISPALERLLRHLSSLNETGFLNWAEAAAHAAEDLRPDATAVSVRVTADLLPALTPALLAADWGCYARPADRVDYPRLRDIVAAFPQGFTVYFAETIRGDIAPVAYTGWYPIADDIFQMLEAAPHKIDHRGKMKPVSSRGAHDFIYLFNYSVVPALIGSVTSRRMIKALAVEIDQANPAGLAAVTVSAHGMRVAEKFNMRESGQMTHLDESEAVFTWRRS